MKATVLYHKRGLITEDRFKNLTKIQWIYHYLEIKKMKEEENKNISSLFKILIDEIRENAELAGTMGNPLFDLKKYLDIKKREEEQKKQKEKNKEKEKGFSMPETEEGKAKFIKKLYDIIPKELIPDKKSEERLTGARFILPKYHKKKKRGIGQIKSVNGDGDSGTK